MQQVVIIIIIIIIIIIWPDMQQVVGNDGGPSSWPRSLDVVDKCWLLIWRVFTIELHFLGHRWRRTCSHITVTINDTSVSLNYSVLIVESKSMPWFEIRDYALTMYNIFMILSNVQCLLFLKIKISLINPTYWSMMLSDELADVTDCLGTSSGQDLHPILCD